MCMGWYTWFSPGADLQGGWAARAPLQLVHQWKYGEGEREEELEKRKKWREMKKKRPTPLQSCSASATSSHIFFNPPMK